MYKFRGFRHLLPLLLPADFFGRDAVPFVTLPLRWQPLLFAGFMSGFMAFFMSGILTLVNLGWVDGFFGKWLHAFLIAWPIAFPLVLLFAPLTRKLLARGFRFQ